MQFCHSFRFSAIQLPCTEPQTPTPKRPLGVLPLLNSPRILFPTKNFLSHRILISRQQRQLFGYFLRFSYKKWMAMTLSRVVQGLHVPELGGGRARRHNGYNGQPHQDREPRRRRAGRWSNCSQIVSSPENKMCPPFCNWSKTNRQMYGLKCQCRQWQKRCDKSLASNHPAQNLKRW